MNRNVVGRRPLRLRFRHLQSRLGFPYSPRWLRRVGASLRHRFHHRVFTVQASAHRPRPAEFQPDKLPAPIVRWARSPIGLPGTHSGIPLYKRAKQDRLSRISASEFLRGNARMSTEGVQQPGLEDEDLLEGWKAIADHLNKTERTVQRWEKSKGLPIRRLKAGSPEEQGRVFAYRTELDTWWKEMLAKADVIVDLAPESEVSPLKPATPNSLQIESLTKIEPPD